MRHQPQRAHLAVTNRSAGAGDTAVDRADEILPRRVNLGSLFPDSRFVGATDVVVQDITTKADDVQPGTVYAATRGSQFDSAAFIQSAIHRGASALVLNRPWDENSIPQCIVPSVRSAFARICAALAGPKAAKIQVLGVTGTNGKSTTAWMMRSILQSAGRSCGILGTIEYHDGQHGEPATLTTPDPKTLWNWLARMGAAQTNFAALELSSHALHQRRAEGLKLAAAVVTNVTHDHLDYHGSLEAYWESKTRIFELLSPTSTAIVNLDDPAGARMTSRIPGHLDWLGLSLNESADVSAGKVELGLRGSTFQLETPWGCR
ncbi:MAG: hypothetical protein B7Z55_18165, partial [Planctomycetales bacterium 12-60-4]